VKLSKFSSIIFETFSNNFPFLTFSHVWCTSLPFSACSCLLVLLAKKHEKKCFQICKNVKKNPLLLLPVVFFQQKSLTAIIFLLYWLILKVDNFSSKTFSRNSWSLFHLVFQGIIFFLIKNPLFQYIGSRFCIIAFIRFCGLYWFLKSFVF